jgi:hypothetical protein
LASPTSKRRLHTDVKAAMSKTNEAGKAEAALLQQFGRPYVLIEV